MKKTLVAMAVLAASGATFAQVTITGRAALGVASISATGATNPAQDQGARTVVEDLSSRLRVSANQDLGNGRRMFAVYEWGLSFDTGTENTQNGVGPAVAVAGTTANGQSNVGFGGSRESHVGIGNSLMELRIGRQNVYWTQGDLSETGANKVGKDVIADMYTRVANVRQNNAVLLQLNSDGGGFAGSQLYWAPEVSNETQPAGSPSAAQGSPSASTYGGKLNWDKGSMHFMADYQKRTNIAGDVPNLFPAATAVFDATSIKLGFGYRYAQGSMVAVHYWDMKKEFQDAATNAAAITGSFSGAGGQHQTGWALSLTHNVGGGLFGYANYGSLSTISGTVGPDLADSGTTGFSVGARQELSKEAAVFFAAGKVSNGANANYAPTGGGFMPFTTPNGSSPTFVLLGMMYNF
jgi:predicted porin